MITECDLDTRLARFLFSYTTPHTTTGVSPAELLMNRKLRSPLDLLSPSVEDKVLEKQYSQKRYYDLHNRERRLCVGDSVMVESLGKGIITEQSGSLSF